jgi:hypothetical protein
MEDGRARMVNAILVLVLVGLAAAFVNALFRHDVIRASECSVWDACAVFASR